MAPLPQYFFYLLIIITFIALAAGSLGSMIIFWRNPNRGSMWAALCVMTGASVSLIIKLPPFHIKIGASETGTVAILLAAVTVFVVAAVLNTFDNDDNDDHKGSASP
jgi:hypothetical protein